MPLFKRILFYLGGFGIGLIILYFYVGQSGASCDYSYGPNARTLKNIRMKDRVVTENATLFLSQNGLDTSAISALLLDGNVLFSESNTKLDSCKIYAIEGEVLDKNIKMMVENCDELVSILEVYKNKD